MRIHRCIYICLHTCVYLYRSRMYAVLIDEERVSASISFSFFSLSVMDTPV